MEFFDIVNDKGECIGIAPRRVCHGNPALMHRTAHVVVRSADGRLLLQKRSMLKDIQPGKWDTAVGGHLGLGETPLEGALREMSEEIGIADIAVTPLFEMSISNAMESELTSVFGAVCDGPFTRQESEVDELRFWTRGELDAAMGGGELTPYLEHELRLLFKTDFLD